MSSIWATFSSYSAVLHAYQANLQLCAKFHLNCLILTGYKYLWETHSGPSRITSQYFSKVQKGFGLLDRDIEFAYLASLISHKSTIFLMHDLHIWHPNAF